MAIKIVPVSSEHIPTLAQICYDAFGTLHDRHAVPRDFTSLEGAGMMIEMFAKRHDFAGFVAVDGAEILGSNFLCFSNAVAGVGPITVRPDAQSRGVGRLLMEAVIDESKRRHFRQVRLVQETINTASLSLYMKLGFDWRDGCAQMKPAPAATDDSRISPLLPGDLNAVDRLSARHYHTSRRNEVEGLLKSGNPGFLLEQEGRTVGYYLPGILGHGFAEGAEDLAALVTHAARHSPPQFHCAIVPLSQNDLHRSLLKRGCRTLKLLSYMSMGPYQPPVEAWMPSIGM